MSRIQLYMIFVIKKNKILLDENIYNDYFVLRIKGEKMNSSVFIPLNEKDLYEKMVKEKFIGQLSFDENLLLWSLPNGITINIVINNQPHEGYIDTYYTINGKKCSLTHWHPMEDEIYQDLTDINNGQTFWIIKKRKFIFEPLPIIIEKEEYKSFSEKKKKRYFIL